MTQKIGLVDEDVKTAITTEIHISKKLEEIRNILNRDMKDCHVRKITDSLDISEKIISQFKDINRNYPE